MSQLLAKNKDDAAGIYLLGKIELAEQSPQQAYQWLKKADRLAPNEPDVTNSLMAVCSMLGKTQEANHYQRLLEEIHARDAELDELTTAAKSRPDDATLRFQVGMACLKLHRNDEAAHWYAYWRDARFQWYVALGLRSDRLRLRDRRRCCNERRARLCR